MRLRALSVLGLAGFLGMAFAVRAGEAVIAAEDGAWLVAHPRVTFSYDPAWAPFSYRDEAGEFAGLDADVLRVLSGRLGVTFVPVHAADWPDAYRRARSGEAQVLTSTARTPERDADFLFTRPYVSFPVAILTRATEPDFDDLSLLVGRRVAAVRDYAPTLALRRDFPEIELVDCASMAEALRMVAAGRADAAITNLVNATHVIREEGLAGLKVAGVGPYAFQLRLAVRRDAPELYRALDAGVATLGREDRQALVAPYVRMETGAIVSWHRAARWFVGACALAVLIIAGVAWHNYRLRRELAERRRLLAELEASRDRLSRLNEEKSGLMRMAAHDLRNPLTGMLMSIDLLRMDDPGTRDQALDRMVAQVHQMMHLIRNLLDVQALEAGTRQFRPERILVDAAVEESLATFEPSARRKSIALDYAASEPGLSLRADRSALRQICDNLVSNAVKYSPPGSRIRVAAARSEGGRVRICVGDEGPGIRPDEMERLFEKYTCLSARPTAGEPSTGLGLSIVKELVQRLGGRVWCESAPGRGASFLVELPASDPAALPSEAAVLAG